MRIYAIHSCRNTSRPYCHKATGTRLGRQLLAKEERMFLTQVEVRWSVGVEVPEGVRPSPANRGQLGMNVVLFM